MLWNFLFRGCYVEDVNNLLVSVIGFSDYKVFKEESNPLSMFLSLYQNITNYVLTKTYTLTYAELVVMG